MLLMFQRLSICVIVLLPEYAILREMLCTVPPVPHRPGIVVNNTNIIITMRKEPILSIFEEIYATIVPWDSSVYMTRYTWPVVRNRSWIAIINSLCSWIISVIIRSFKEVCVWVCRAGKKWAMKLVTNGHLDWHWSRSNSFVTKMCSLKTHPW